MKLTKLLTSLSAFTLLASSASAELLVYEGFDYGNADTVRSGADLLDGQPDGIGGDGDAIGLSGSWSGGDTADDLFMYSGSLGFGDLATSGNSIRTDTNNGAQETSRTISTSLSGTSTGELWFSFTAQKLQNNFNAAEGGIVIGNKALGNARVFENDGTDGLTGFGIAPTTSGDDWMAYGWNGSSQVAGGSALGVGVGSGDTRLLVEQVQYGAGTGGADIFTFYDQPDTSLASSSLVEVTSLEVDADESLLDTLNVTRQVNTAYDEIRIGASYDDVSPVPEASTFALIGLSGLFLLRRRRR